MTQPFGVPQSGQNPEGLNNLSSSVEPAREAGVKAELDGRRRGSHNKVLAAIGIFLAGCTAEGLPGQPTPLQESPASMSDPETVQPKPKVIPALTLDGKYFDISVLGEVKDANGLVFTVTSSMGETTSVKAPETLHNDGSTKYSEYNARGSFKTSIPRGGYYDFSVADDKGTNLPIPGAIDGSGRVTLPSDNF